MPITFTVTCDSDEELARFLENLRFGEEFALTAEQAKAAIVTASPKTQETSKRPGRRKVAGTAGIRGKKRAVPKTLRTGRAPGRKSGKLTPIIQTAMNDIIRKGKPFRAKDVTALVMKREPSLNESSVTTGVSKLLSDTRLDYDQIKDTVGRPYKLFKP